MKGLGRGFTLVAAVIVLTACGVLGWQRWGPAPAGAPPDHGPAMDFSMTSAAGDTLRSAELKGAPWILDFIFTRCPGTCPAMSREMARLQEELPQALRFVSMTVDPDFDTPQVLAQYGARYGAQPGRWHFLNAAREEVFRVAREGFKQTAMEGDPAQDAAGAVHSTRFTLVDAAGHIRGYYDCFDEEHMARLRADALWVLEEAAPAGGDTPAWVRRLPTLNAGINALVSLLLVLGLIAVRSGRVQAHKRIMAAAVVLAAIFLSSYLTYHSMSHLLTRFTREGWPRPFYFTVLISHTILAATTLPLIVTTLLRAARGQWERHKAIAVWTFPLWLYVSVTGVLVYVLLYIVWPPA